MATAPQAESSRTARRAAEGARRALRELQPPTTRAGCGPEPGYRLPEALGRLPVPDMLGRPDAKPPDDAAPYQADAGFPGPGPGNEAGGCSGRVGGLSPKEEEFFRLLKDDAVTTELDAKAEANVVHGSDSHRSAAEPWLRRTGIEEHARGLRKDEMHAPVAAPKSADEEPELFLMLEVMDEILTEAHKQCFDGPECMLTWPRQLALSRFSTASTGKLRGFEPKKEPGTLRTNFGYWKQFLTYCYRVAYRGGYLTRTEGDEWRTPEDRIRLTDTQTAAWEAALQSAASNDRPALRDQLSVLSMALICHEFGGDHFSSMLSVKPRTKTWKEPGNFNSCLSGLIWVVQLLIVGASVYLEKSGAGGTLERIEGASC
ncbi:hypothetical protein V502_02883 [Pseudogymnoascus sp. VKM F-4520 (FW-2644)]|nr:hypothetical protein V502_02883 [Pseudogymnoascus sp. VKM F-4520 (FW-2644)]